MIQRNIASQLARASGFVGTDAVVARALIVATSSGGAPSTRSKNARPGSGRASAAMNSQRPSSTKASISRVTSARVGASQAATAAGVKWALISRR